ncbi:MAG: LuxR C-terminal-related transcriptional regulator [Aquabacterium sp.]|nr:LuxR C-terminal-related transcriptional regulator [Aquabacterium sp.]
MINPNPSDDRARAGPGAAHGDALILSPEQAQAVVRLVEAAPAVRRRYQFFVWTQSQMQALLPHQLLVCGAYQRQRRALVLDAFHSVVLSTRLLQQLTDGSSPLQTALLNAWISGRGRPRAVALAQLGGAAADDAQLLGRELGCHHLLVHGVSRPQRLNEVESLFVLGAGGEASDSQQVQRLECLELMLPHLHSTWQRTAATEHDLQMQGVPTVVQAHLRGGAAVPQRTQSVVTAREQQILRWVREGLSNHAIAEVLGISPLTVKNHIQKILRKLHAGNRAQAVAQALAQHLIDAAEPPERTPKSPPPAPTSDTAS